MKVDTSGKPGIYTIKMNAPSMCYVQVRGDSPLTVWAGYVSSVGQSNTAHSDQPSIPAAGGKKCNQKILTKDCLKTAKSIYNIVSVENTLILHMSGELGENGFLTYTELINQYDGSVLVLSLYRR